jgi:hypothetical protein
VGAVRRGSAQGASALASQRAAVAESERLRGKIGIVLPELLAAGERLVGHARIRDLYPEYLFTTHCVIRASVPLMRTALSRAEVLAADDPVAAGLATYLAGHVDEELDHDEWLLDDLEAIGGDRAAALRRPPPATVAGLAGAQYYWIAHYHPVALLGYVAVLEGYPPSARLIEELAAATGYGPDAFRTLRAHGELDPHHRRELDEAIDGLPLTPEQSSAMGVSAMWSVHMLARAIDEIVSDAV